MKTIAVTGASGFLGADLVRELAEGGYRVLACTRSAPPKALMHELRPFGDQISWRDLDVTQPDQWAALGQDVDTVIHGAAATPTDESDTRGVVNVNLLGTLNGMEYALNAGVRRFISMSSASVYRGLPFEDTPLHEDTPVRPVHSYGIAKVAVETFVTLYRELKNLDCCAVRLTSIYGPWERPTGSRAGMSAAYRLTTAAAAGVSLAVRNEDGACDWMYVSDASKGLIHLTELDEIPHDIINLSSGELISADRLLKAVHRAFPEAAPRLLAGTDGGTADVTLRPTRDGRRLDVDRLAKLGFRAPTSIGAGIERYAEWLRNSDNLAAVRGQRGAA